MGEVNYNWQDRISDSKAAGMAAKEFFVVFTEPAESRLAVLELLPIHLEYQRRLEEEGIIVAAGPLSDDKGQEWTGVGMIILRAESLAAAREIAEDDPMHKQKVRKFRILPWLMNEFSLTIRFSYLNRSITLS